MKTIYFIALGFFSVAIGFATGCSTSGDGTGAISADKPSTAIAAVSAATKTAGTSIGASGISAAAVGVKDIVFHPNDISQDCSNHAQPLRAGVSVANTDQDYPGKFMYCKLAYNTEDEESVQGAFTFIKSISCMLEKAGIIWDGAPHSFTITTGLDCFSSNQLTNMGGTQTMTVSVTASTPAAFNTYYDRGISIDIPGQGVFKVATKVSNTKVEFASEEDNHVAHAGHYGAFAASLDFTTGDLRYESRTDRFNDTTESNSGGFNRHQRIYAKLTTAGQEVTGLVSVSAAQTETYNGAVQGGYGGQTITASGDLTNGIKARFFKATDGSGGAATSEAHIDHASFWTETANARCYTDSGPNGGGCSAGISIPTTNSADSFPFTLNGTYTASDTWFTSLGAMTFTSVDPSHDTQ